MPQPCAVCQADASKKCGQCGAVHYCSRDHQKEHWKSHKKECAKLAKDKPAPTPGASPGSSGARQQSGGTRSSASSSGRGPQGGYSHGPPLGVGQPSTRWAEGLTPAKAAEWFVDCFRMRMDDDQAWCGAENHAIYFGSPLHTVREFLIFCNMAVDRGVFPSTIPWTKVLEQADDLLVYAFEKADAQEKYGSENVFAELTGGRSLRATGVAIYAFGPNGEPASAEFKAAQRKYPDDNTLFDDATRFARVGGIDKWRALCASLERKFPLNGRFWD
ncbi:hypothetical protein GGF32_009374 [Allomyces javanicus]|nr:hypothetical protein GGF32_009374 [Allomyces javanicus]